MKKSLTITERADSILEKLGEQTWIFLKKVINTETPKEVCAENMKRAQRNITIMTRIYSKYPCTREDHSFYLGLYFILRKQLQNRK